MLRAGSVADALAASSAVPSIFPPVAWHGRLLVDGDVAEKVPVTAAKALQAGPIVAVDVSNRVIPSEPRSALEAALQAGEASRRRLLSIALAQADLVIALEADPPHRNLRLHQSPEGLRAGPPEGRGRLTQNQRAAVQTRSKPQTLVVTFCPAQATDAKKRLHSPRNPESKTAPPLS